jgi:N-acetylmuramoyl-L-alanine amidase
VHTLIFVFLLLLTGCNPPVYREIETLPQPILVPPPQIIIDAPKVREKPIVITPSPIKVKQVILIDAGHGGEDHGARSLTTPRYQEKNLTLATSKLLKLYLEQLGYAAIMTRNEDLFVSLEKRAKIANQLQPELFVSVHYNSAPSKEADGIEVYFFKDKENPSRAKASRQLAENILAQLLETTRAKSRGVKHGNFLVIRETAMPAVLVECGFLTHSEEMERIRDTAYLKKLAWGIAQGVHAYIQKKQ